MRCGRFRGVELITETLVTDMVYISDRSDLGRVFSEYVTVFEAWFSGNVHGK